MGSPRHDDRFQSSNILEDSMMDHGVRQPSIRRSRTVIRRRHHRTTTTTRTLVILATLVMTTIVVLSSTVLLLSSFQQIVDAKEIEATKEWQLLGENDTIPAGLHIRMDMTTGEKWVKLPDDDEEKDNNNNDSDDNSDNDINTSDSVVRDSEGSSSSSSSSSGVAMAVIQEDGTVSTTTATAEGTASTKSSDSNSKKNYDYDMMHRTLSKLPLEEQERMGGLPELPPTKSSSSTTTTASTTAKDKKLRELFEKRMLEIWERRQEELASLQEAVVDLPDLLKDRIQGIDEYLKDPAKGRRQINLHTQDVPDGVITDLLTLLEDLEFQLTDVDMARDFHTMGGWSLLASLLAESSHIPTEQQRDNRTATTTTTTSTSTTDSVNALEDRSKIFKIQALAAWCMGTAVKNTGEFTHYAIEPIMIDTTMGKEPVQTTPIDLLIDVCSLTDLDANENHSWDARNLLIKSIYAIGSMLRGNRPAQAHVVLNTNGIERLGKKYSSLVTSNGQGGYTIDSADMKLFTRLASLVSDIVDDVVLHPELADEDTNKLILEKMSTDEWCDTTCQVFLGDSFLPMKTQETMLRSITVMSPYCNWTCDATSFQSSLREIHKTVVRNRDDYDIDHFQQMETMIQDAMTAVQNSNKS